MAERGDVLQLKRRLGFGREHEGERVVVIQSTPLNAALPTLVVVPLDSGARALARQPFVARVSAREAGSAAECVAVATHVMTIRADRLVPGRVGRLLPATLMTLDDQLRLVLDL